MFHLLARTCADGFIGSKNADRSNPAWRQVYRSLEHGHSKNQCQRANKNGFPKEVVDFADTYAVLQEERHGADYDPQLRLSRSEVLQHIDTAEAAMKKFSSAQLKDRRAFAAFVLLKQRS